MNKKLDVMVIEDNGGGLHIVTLKGGEPTRAYHGFENGEPGNLSAAFKALTRGYTVVGYTERTPAEPFWSEVCADPMNYKVVARLNATQWVEHDHLMGVAARRAFGRKD